MVSGPAPSFRPDSHPLFESLPEKATSRWPWRLVTCRVWVKPQETAHLSVFIAENDYVNGECIRLDGAIRMQPRWRGDNNGAIERLHRVIELAGIGPAPMGAWCSADMGGGDSYRPGFRGQSPDD